MNRTHLRLLPPLLLAALVALLLAGLAAAGGPGVGPAAAPPIPETNITFDSDVLSVAVQGNYAYVGLESGVVILDITNPLQPVRRGFLDTSVGFPPYAITSPRYLQIEGDLLVISNGSLIATVDVSDSDHPTLLSPYQQYTTYAVPFKLLNRYLYIVETGKFHIFDLHDPTQIQEIYKLDDERLFADIDSMDAETHPLDGRTYVYMVGYSLCSPAGCPGGNFLMMDVTNLTNPQILPQAISIMGVSPAIRVEQTYAYIIDSDLTIYDISDPSSFQLAGNYYEDNAIFVGLEVSNNKLATGDQYGSVLYQFDTTDKVHPKKIAVHRNVNGYPDAFSVNSDCVFIPEKERGLHILCEAQLPPHPPVQVWLPMVQARFER